MLSPELFDLSARNQFYLQQLSTSEYEKALPYLKRAEKYITEKLLDAGNTITSAKQYRQLKSDINKELDKILGEFESEYNLDLSKIAVQQGESAGLSLELVLEDYKAVFPDNDQMLRAGYIRPLMMNNTAISLEDYIKDWKPSVIKKVEGVITNGFFDGTSTSEMIKAIRGSKTQRGIVQQTKSDTEKMVRTSIAQISTNARNTTFKANSVIIGYELVAVLDIRTSKICMNFDGQEFLYKDKYNPLPPFHPYCRTTNIPLLKDNAIFKDFDQKSTRASFGADGGQSVSANFTYYEWLKTQPASFQDKAIGKTQGKIFRNAGLSIQEFKDATVTEMNKPRTIEQMQNYNKKIKDYLDK